MHSRWFILSIRSCMAICFLLTLIAHAARPNYERRICTWAAIGPFSPTSADGYDQDFLSGEAAIEPQLGKSVNGHAWLYFDDRLYCRNQDDYNNFFTFYMPNRSGGPGGGTENKVAYAAVYVWSPAVQSAQLKFGANEKAKVWLNGKLELEQTTASQALRDTQMRPVQLRAGWNTLLVKVINVYEVWGFYCGITSPDGKPVEGLAYSPDLPQSGKDLEILTQAMPIAYSTQPYVHLFVPEREDSPRPLFPADNPSASPYRFCARGGTPPYKWAVEGLPNGLKLDPEEGELVGKTAMDDEGSHNLNVTLTDASSPPKTIHKQLTLTIKPRVTRKWWETGRRIGGLRHSEGPHNAELEAELAALQGITWIAPTMLDSATWDGHHMKLNNSAMIDEYKQAMQKRGIRICNYIGGADMGIKVPHLCTSALHERVRLLMERDKPGLLWLDGSGAVCHKLCGNVSWEFDALFSMVKTIDPDCLLIPNAGGGDHLDYDLGDLDVLSLEGNNNRSPSDYWSRWPTVKEGSWWRNPKFKPVDTWRYPATNADDWRIWAKVIVTLLAEDENYLNPRMCNLDLSPKTETLEMHRSLGKWLQPRMDPVLASFPEMEMTVGSMGFCVYVQAHPEVRYVHLISNPRGKTGWSSGDVVIEHVAFPVKSIKLYPQLKDLMFSQDGEKVTVKMEGIVPDEVDTILQVLPR